MDDAAQLPERLVLFDGDCAVCNRAVQFLLDHDPEGVFHYAPLQGPTAAGIVARHPALAELDSLVFVDAPGTPDETPHVHAGAVFATAALLPAPWRWIRFGRLLPRAITDAAYKAFAASRYSVFGAAEACRIPLPDQVARFHA